MASLSQVMIARCGGPVAGPTGDVVPNSLDG
jgi:hypothetical protein